MENALPNPPPPEGRLLIPRAAAFLALSALLPLFAAAVPIVTGPSWSRFDAVEVLFFTASWWSCVPLALLVVRLEQRFPLSGAASAKHWLLHLGAGAFAALLQSLWFAFVAWILPVEYSPQLALQQSFDVFWGVGAVTQLFYWSVLLGSSLRSLAVRAAEREAQFAEARLAALQTQLRPHFLFNALNTLSALIDEDTGAAQRALSSLSDLLRASLSNGALDHTTLEDELALTSLYINVEQARFEERLRVAIDVDPSLLAASVPSLLLQPLVENAIHHGMRGSTPVTVRLEARRRGADLELCVSDNGKGFSEQHGAGIGLANVQQRLKTLYGAQASLRLECRVGLGTAAKIRLPWTKHGEPA